MQHPAAEALARPRLRYGTFTQSIREIVELIVLVGVIYTLVNLASARFVVEGPSMQPNFHSDEFLLVSRVNYLLGEPTHGDVVVFHYPNDTTQDYIKRIIGVPGDLIEIRDTQVYVNGQMLDEPYINEPCTETSCRDNSWQLGENEYFMMGDNRNHSSDSRVFGAVPRSLIVGKALLRYWPPQDWGIVVHYE